jgi:homeobox-leucine zipper protein
VEDTTDEGAAVSSPNSAASSFRMDFSIMNGNGDARNCSREGGVDSDDEENGSTRKKLRLSKDQSAFLEETFKEHTTLNPVRTIVFHFLFLFYVIYIFE